MRKNPQWSSTLKQSIAPYPRQILLKKTNKQWNDRRTYLQNLLQKPHDPEGDESSVDQSAHRYPVYRKKNEKKKQEREKKRMRNLQYKYLTNASFYHRIQLIGLWRELQMLNKKGRTKKGTNDQGLYEGFSFEHNPSLPNSRREGTG